MHLMIMQTAEGRLAQRSNTTPGQAEIFHALDIVEPGGFLNFEISTPHTSSQVSDSRSHTTGWNSQHRFS